MGQRYPRSSRNLTHRSAPGSRGGRSRNRTAVLHSGSTIPNVLMAIVRPRNVQWYPSYVHFAWSLEPSRFSSQCTYGTAPRSAIMSCMRSRRPRNRRERTSRVVSSANIEPDRYSRLHRPCPAGLCHGVHGPNGRFRLTSNREWRPCATCQGEYPVARSS
jgi:hypothetical protein